ncbi:hypothetical protein AAMO2058_001623300 [Amorphochlora amoebiformis]
MEQKARPLCICGYDLGQTLGKGATSVTKVGVHKDTAERIAVKIMFLDGICHQRLQKLQRAFDTEKKMLQNVSHKHVLCLKFAEWEYKVQLPDQSSRTAAVLGLELAHRGELMDHLLSAGQFSEKVARTLFHNLVDGLSACHARGIVHRDLKPENILLDENFILKIADFGFSRIEPEDGMTTMVGTRAYMAPEVLAGATYTSKADIWSLGVILFIMYVGYPPYNEAKRSDYWWHALVTSPNLERFWSGHVSVGGDQRSFPNDFRDIVNRILRVNPRDRADLKEIQNHSWYRKAVYTQQELTKVLNERKCSDMEIEHQLYTEQVKGGSGGEGTRGMFYDYDLVYRDIVSAVGSCPKNVYASLKALEKRKVKIGVFDPKVYVGAVSRAVIKGHSPSKVLAQVTRALRILGHKVNSLELPQDEPGNPIRIGLSHNQEKCTFDMVVYSDGVKSIKEAKESSVEMRIDSDDGKLYTLEKFKAMYGPTQGELAWEEAGKAPSEGTVVVFQRLSGRWKQFAISIQCLKRLIRNGVKAQEKK